MDRKEHIKRHKELHKALDELVADYLDHNIHYPKHKPLSEISIIELIKWSSEETKNPSTKD